MTRRDEPGRGPEERGTSATLGFVIVAVAAVCIGAAGVRFGPWAAVAALGAGAMCFAAGRVFGVSAGLASGVRARADLRDRLVEAEQRLVRSQLTALRAPSRDDEKALLSEIARREAAEQALEAERADRLSTNDESRDLLDRERLQRKTLEEQAQRAIAEERRQRQILEEQAKQLRTAAATAQREAERLSNQQNGALREVERVLAPYIEREKLLLDLARINAGSQSRQDLPAILDSIAAKGNFGSIVLADESGLPVAASRGTRDPEGTAATSSLLFTLADRLAAHGQPAPIAVLVHDEGDETILHRLFRAGEDRYLLTATGRGRGVVPETLDPTLDTIERALLHEAWAS